MSEDLRWTLRREHRRQRKQRHQPYLIWALQVTARLLMFVFALRNYQNLTSVGSPGLRACDTWVFPEGGLAAPPPSFSETQAVGTPRGPLFNCAFSTIRTIWN